MICGECKYSKRDWTNPQNTDYYCSNEYSDAYGCNTMYTDGCEEGEPMIKPIKVHPVNSASIILWGDDGNKEHTLIKARNCVASIISFDKRQIWEVYPYKEHSGDVGYCGACERNGMYIRLMPDDFIRIFGKDIVDRAERRTDG